MEKNYSILDKWTDLGKENVVNIKSIDGVIQESGGGGGGDFSTIKIGIMIDPVPTPGSGAVVALMRIPTILELGEYGEFATITEIMPNTAGVVKYGDAITYNGTCSVWLQRPQGYSVKVEGPGSFEEGLIPRVYCTGDCTIKLLGEEMDETEGK